MQRRSEEGGKNGEVGVGLGAGVGWDRRLRNSIRGERGRKGRKGQE